MKVHPIDDPSNTPAAIANTSEKSQFCCVTRKKLLVATALVSVFLIIYFGLHLATEPYVRRHITTIPKLKIDSLIASNFTLSSGADLEYYFSSRPDQIYADWNVKMNLETKDSHGYLSFSNITVSIYHNVVQVGLTNVIPFDVVPLNSTRHFDVKFSGSSGLIDDSIIDDISGRITAAGTVTFDVIFEASMKKSFKGRWTDHLQLSMDCKDIKLFFGYSDKSRAQMWNPPHKCKVMGDTYLA